MRSRLGCFCRERAHHLWRAWTRGTRLDELGAPTVNVSYALTAPPTAAATVTAPTEIRPHLTGLSEGWPELWSTASHRLNSTALLEGAGRRDEEDNAGGQGRGASEGYNQACALQRARNRKCLQGLWPDHTARLLKEHRSRPPNAPKTTQPRRSNRAGQGAGVVPFSVVAEQWQLEIKSIDSKPALQLLPVMQRQLDGFLHFHCALPQTLPLRSEAVKPFPLRPRVHHPAVPQAMHRHALGPHTRLEGGGCPCVAAQGRRLGPRGHLCRHRLGRRGQVFLRSRNGVKLEGPAPVLLRQWLQLRILWDCDLRILYKVGRGGK